MTTSSRLRSSDTSSRFKASSIVRHKLKVQTSTQQATESSVWFGTPQTFFASDDSKIATFILAVIIGAHAASTTQLTGKQTNGSSAQQAHQTPHKPGQPQGPMQFSAIPNSIQLLFQYQLKQTNLLLRSFWISNSASGSCFYNFFIRPCLGRNKNSDLAVSKLGVYSPTYAKSNHALFGPLCSGGFKVWRDSPIEYTAVANIP